MPVPFNILKPGLQKAATRRGFAILMIVLLFIFAGHWLIFDFMVPHTAAFGLPHKWKRVPLRESRGTARNYYGDPVAAEAATDTWYFGGKDKRYILKIYYQYDTVATSYSIRYRYDKWFGARDYILDTATIR